MQRDKGRMQFACRFVKSYKLRLGVQSLLLGNPERVALRITRDNWLISAVFAYSFCVVFDLVRLATESFYLGNFISISVRRDIYL